MLLLEAGGRDDHLYLKMPLAFLKAMPDPRFNWTYWTEPEPHLDGRRMPLPRGRVIGGSGSINGMFAMRGHPKDYDQWAQMGARRLVVRRRAALFPQVGGFAGAAKAPYHGKGGPGASPPDRFAAPAARRDDGDRRGGRLRDQRGPRRRVPRGLRARRADRRPPRPPGQRCDRLPQAGDGAAQPRRALGRAGPAAGVRGQALRRGRDRPRRRAAR